MLIAALVLAGLAAGLHGYIFVLESVRWEHPSTRATFGTSAEQAAITKPLAFNQGFYNLFLAIGSLVGVAVAASGTHRPVGVALILLGVGSMLAAALVLLLSDRSKARAAVTQGVLPLLALLALLISALTS